MGQKIAWDKLRVCFKQAWKKCVSALAECHFANRHFCQVAGTFGLTGGLKRKKRKKKNKQKTTTKKA